MSTSKSVRTKRDSQKEEMIEEGSQGETEAQLQAGYLEAGSTGGISTEEHGADHNEPDHHPCSNEDSDSLVELAEREKDDSFLHGIYEIEPESTSFDDRSEGSLAEPILDSWYAEYGTPEQIKSTINSIDRSSSIAEKIRGYDNRVQIEPDRARKSPWCEICSLRIVAADGSVWKGTGWIVGRRTVITAGHNIYIHRRGGWVRYVDVMPGRTGPDAGPFGKHRAKIFKTVRGWRLGKRQGEDYGAILLDEGDSFHQSLGAFAIASYPDSSLKGLLTNVAGYPDDKRPGTLWYHGLPLKRVTSQFLYYDIDTYGGQSGAPVFLRISGDPVRRVVGIHSYGPADKNDPRGNWGTRITPGVFWNLKTWKDEGNG